MLNTCILGLWLCYFVSVQLFILEQFYTIDFFFYQIEPSRGPADISSSAVSSEKFNVTWLGLLRDVAYGIIINYEVRLSVVENCTEIKSFYDSTINTTTTYVIVTGLSLCAKYEVSVRGYTAEGPGPYSNPVMVQTLGKKVCGQL